MKINIALIDSCISNNRDSQKQLYAILLPYLNVIAQRYLRNKSDINDVLQEAFINIFGKMQQYDVSKSSFKTWATKITINCCLKNNIKQEKLRTDELILPLHESLAEPTVLEKLSNEELLNWFKTMPEQYYEVFNLFVVDDFNHKEIADFLGIEESLSRQRLSRSRAWLKKKLPTGFKRMFPLSGKSMRG